MRDNTLIVAETFYSLQGEGQTMGYPAVFLRLAGCNLLCEGAWRCDTIEVWQKGMATKFEDVFDKMQYAELYRGAHLIITGGEPLLQQASILAYLKWFRKHSGYLPSVEIETNGTIRPDEQLFPFVDYWNVSPKLSNSGMPYEKRVDEVVLRTFQSLTKFGKKVIFKFVIANKEDALEVEEDYGLLDRDKTVFMPAGENTTQLDCTRPMVAELCKLMGVRYCDRLHIVLWNQKTGV